MLYSDNSVNAAWYKQRVSVLDSWTISVAYTQSLSGFRLPSCFFSCGVGDIGHGMAIVVQDSALDALGQGK